MFVPSLHEIQERCGYLPREELEGLSARLVPEVVGQGGWDPAAAYRTFREEMTRLLGRGIRRPELEPQPGEHEHEEERAETGDQPRASDSPHDVQ